MAKKVFADRSVSFSRTKDSKIVESDMMFDKITLLQQLGVEIGAMPK